VRKLTRGGIEMPFNPGTKIDRGDVLTIVGARKAVERAVALFGYADRKTDKTDMTFMGVGIVVGALIGIVTVRLGAVPLSVSTSGGALMAGLVCGWLRSVHRVRSSRVGSGVVARNVEVNDAKLGFTAGMELSAQKARILLMLALTRTSDVKKLQEYFYQY